MNLQLLKNGLKRMLKDEKGATISSETLIVIVGSSIIASVVVGVIATMLTGSNRDGEGGIAEHISDNVKGIIEDMAETGD